VNASPHGDHVNSNNVFEGATIVAHVNARSAMTSAAANAAANASRPRLPGIVFDNMMTLHLGGKTIELHYFGLGHTRGDTVVYLPEEKVAFLSELYFNGVFSSLSEGYAREHLATLDKALNLDAVWFIPGHGHIDGQSSAMLKAGGRRYHDNIKAVHDAVKRHVDRGDPLDKTLAEIDGELGDFAKLPFYQYLKRGCITGTYNALSRKDEEIR
jgi:cyclase